MRGVSELIALFIRIKLNKPKNIMTAASALSIKKPVKTFQYTGRLEKKENINVIFLFNFFDNALICEVFINLLYHQSKYYLITKNGLYEPFFCNFEPESSCSSDLIWEKVLFKLRTLNAYPPPSKADKSGGKSLPRTETRVSNTGAACPPMAGTFFS